MCGIAGVLNAVNDKNTSRFIHDAMVAGMLRGFDSTGIIQMDRPGKIWFDKSANEGLYFAASKVGKQFIEDTGKCAITVVHHRWATQGAITDENAHPFVVRKENQEALVGVHNGSLTQGWKYKPDGNKYEVDSHWALAHIAKHGVDAFKDIHGPFCFAWTEADKRGKLFMVRNSGRPMHILFTEDRKSMMFASEPGMLSWLAERNNMKPDKDILVLIPEHLYEFDTTGNTVTYKSTPLPKTPAMITTPWTPQWVGPSKESKEFIEKIKKAAKGEFLPVLLTGNEIDGAIQAVRDRQAAEKKNEELSKFVADESNASVINDTINKTLASIVSDDHEEDAAVTQRQDDAPFLDENTELVPTTWFDARGTKKAERELAVKTGFFRELYWLVGVVWDEQSGELLGEIDVWDKKNGKQTYAAIIKNISRARAHAEFIDNAKRHQKEGGWVVVTGARVDNTMGTVFVCTELNMIGKSAMADQRKKAN